MRANPSVYVSAECLFDAKHRQGGNFKSSIQSLLDGNYSVQITLPDGPLIFFSSQEFGNWFDAFAQASDGDEGSGDSGD